MSMTWAWAVVLWAGACRAPDTETTPPGGGEQASPAELEIVTQTLPDAVLGEPYDQVVEAAGGVAPITWELRSGALPDGLSLDQATGRISGTPEGGGARVFRLVAEDAAGGRDRVDLEIAVRVPPVVADCDDTVSGTFSQPGLADGGVLQWADKGGYVWLELPLPPEDTTRVALETTSDVTLFALRPGYSQDDAVEDPRFALFRLGNPWIDLASVPDLPAFRAEGGITLLMAANAPTAWEATLRCTDGPVLAQRVAPPVRRGEAVDVDLDVVGSQDGVTFDLVGGGPDWVSLDAATGVLSGTAEEVGSYDLDIEITAGPRSRTETVFFATYEAVPAPCGAEIALTAPLDPVDPNEPPFFADPGLFGIFETELTDPTVSAITLQIEGLVLGLMGPVVEGASVTTQQGPLTALGAGVEEVTISPATWPSIADVRRAGRVLGRATDYTQPLDTTLTVTCDTAPRFDGPALPLLRSGTAAAGTLEAVGGTPPYTWSADGLPAGLTLAKDGSWAFDGSAPAGAFTVEITVEDSTGASTTEDHPLWVDEASVCDTVLRCGDVVTDTFVLDWDTQRTAGTRAFCLSAEERERERITATVTPGEGAALWLDALPPGKHGLDGYFDRPGVPVVFVQTDQTEVVVDAASQPPLDAYAGLPVGLLLWSQRIGDYTLEVACEGSASD